MRSICLSLGLLLAAAALATADLVTGTVLAPDGQPVAGAEVVIEPIGPEGLGRPVMLTTDAAGAFSIELAWADPTTHIYGRAAAFVSGYGVGGTLMRETQVTVRTWPAAQAWGSVVDEAGKPVAGARVVAEFVAGADGEREFVSIPEALQERVAATTSADGRYVIANLPSSGTVTLALKDPRFPRASTQVRLGPGAPAAEPLVARAGATIAGRIVYSGGRPAEGVKVFAQGRTPNEEGWAQATSEADGSYLLSSLGAGSYNVMADDPSGQWVAAALQNVNVQAGETASAPDLVLTAGAVVEGLVTDADTGRGVAGVYVGSYGPHRPRTTAAIISTQTDVGGHFRLRVAPGESYVYISGAPPEYFRSEENATVTLVPGGVRQVPFKLKKGLTLSGAATEQYGKPAAGATFTLSATDSERDSEGHQAVVNPDGSFSVSPLIPGTYTLQGEREWQVVQPTEVTLPTPGPVRVTLRKVALLALTGRVVTPNGTPVAGATVHVQMFIPAGAGVGTGGSQQATTDVQGRYVLEEIDPNAEGLKASAESEGYVYVSGGVVTKKEGGFGVTDIVLSPLNSSVEGRVVSAEGKPVAGVQVLVPEGAPDARAVSDPTGHFFLAGAPGGEIHVVAAQGNSFGDVRIVAPNAQVQVVLRPVVPLKSSDVLRGFAILSDVLSQSEGKDYYARESLGATLAPYDPDLALKLAQGSDSPWALSSTIGILADTNPTRAVTWGPAHLDGIKEPSQRGLAAVMVALAAAPTNPEVAKQLYERAKQALPTTGTAPEVLMGRALLVGVAGRLRDPAAESTLAQVIADAKAASTGGDDRGLMDAIIEGAARGSAALTERALELANPTGRQRISATSRAIGSLCDYDPAAARRLLDGMKPDGDETAGHYYGVAAKRVIVAIGETDPAGALAVAKTVSEPGQRAQALALAAQFQAPAASASVFREAQQAAAGDAGKMAWIASLARVKDEALGAELFAAARQAAGDGFGPEFAFYWAQVNPAEARLRLEVEFAQRQHGDNPRGRFFSLAPPVLAMSAVDVDRALELARSIPKTDVNSHFDSQRKIAQYVLASEEVRRTMPFDRWTASDTWVPGTPTGW